MVPEMPARLVGSRDGRARSAALFAAKAAEATRGVRHLINLRAIYTRETLLEKLGIDWEKAKAEFTAYLEDVKQGRVETLYDPKKAITSGPGYVKPKAIAAAQEAKQ